ncbi:MAG TPA: SurA N-terminal domain-containing protein [Candidatus Nanoarchaeia archaeon]|nr:SurA N-terminal domain-containing protein [Candidatus Nanoarchaeia archaeon]
MRRKSRQQGAKSKKNTVLLAALGTILLIGIALALYALLNKGSFIFPSREIAATVNGEAITMRELDASYATGVPEQFQQSFTRWQFLNESIIPQKLLLQKATALGYLASDDEVKSSLNGFLLENQMTADQLESQLEASGLSPEDLEETIRTRLTLSAFVNETILPTITIDPKEIKREYDENEFENQGISLEEAAPYISQQLLSSKQSYAVLAEIATLRSNAQIVIYLEEAKQGISSFIESQAPLCAADNKPIIRMFTASSCDECKGPSKRLKSLLQSPELLSEVNGHIWEIDTGDDLLTPQKETGVPKSEIGQFFSISPNREVPAYSFGCKYTRVGQLPDSAGNLNAEEKEFKEVILTLLVENG